MKYRIDYNLKGQARFWVCESDVELQHDDALAVVLSLHAHSDPVADMRNSKPATVGEQRVAVSDLGISDVRLQLLG
ncbi:hypothetical protein G7011_01315 [Pseudomonas plecoglossicida]|uniref:hypothetical protein n=1 Tax=Pseudomonas plecoglossicida TaxID=70775 RepID=UPI0015E34D9A|nr:hypothetical protein [Pseudomonas plecoglossicida]MBA1195750.1 hypothetical protein [Pseudomonas plecoglossicida]